MALSFWAGEVCTCRLISSISSQVAPVCSIRYPLPHRSIAALRLVIDPLVLGLLSASLPASQAAAASSLFGALHSLLWLIPAYVITFAISRGWYNEIGERTTMAAQREAQRELASRAGVVAPAARRPVQVSSPDALTQLSQGLYWLMLVLSFLGVACVAHWVPFIGET